MKGLNIRSDEQHRTVHKARIDEEALLALCIDHVAQRLGLDSTAPNVSVRAYRTSYTEGSLGTPKTRVEVELIEDHKPDSAAPAAS